LNRYFTAINTQGSSAIKYPEATPAAGIHKVKPEYIQHGEQQKNEKQKY